MARCRVNQSNVLSPTRVEDTGERTGYRTALVGDVRFLTDEDGQRRTFYDGDTETQRRNEIKQQSANSPRRQTTCKDLNARCMTLWNQIYGS